MRFLLTILLALFAVAMISCGATGGLAPSNGQAEEAADISSPFGGSLDGVELLRSGSGFELRVDAVPASGVFLRISLPDKVSIVKQEWDGNDQLLTLMIPTDQGADVGLVPLPGYTGGPTRVNATYGKALRRVSVPPTGSGSVISDLIVEDLGGGSVGLSWTAHNQGDYNFDGQVTVTDLTPIGLFFLEAVNRSLDSSPLNTKYWVDGNADKVVNIGDLTPIGQNYLANLAAYQIARNGGAPIEVLANLGTVRTNLPRVFNVAVTGAVGDSWVITAVDGQGNKGANSLGDTAVDLRAKLTITGPDLFNLDGNGSGQFGPGKFSSRVILPIDVVQRGNITGQPKLLPDGVTTIVGGLAGYKRVYLDFRYAPTINLADGTPRGAVSVKNSSKNGDDDGGGGGDDDPPGDDSGGGTDDGEGDFDGVVNPADVVLTSIPIDLPLDGAVDVDVNINIEPNTGGDGYFVTVVAEITYPGDDPDTVEFELSYTRTWSTRLEYATSRVRVDTDNDGDFEDELESIDDDRDCLSDDDTATDIEDLEFEAAGYIRTEVKCEAKFISLPGEGLIRFMIAEAGIDFDHSDDLAELIIGERSFKYNADTEFENDIDAEPLDLLPTDLAVEDLVELKLYFYHDAGTLVTEPKNSLRVEQVKRIAHGNPI